MAVGTAIAAIGALGPAQFRDCDTQALADIISEDRTREWTSDGYGSWWPWQCQANVTLTVQGVHYTRLLTSGCDDKVQRALHKTPGQTAICYMTSPATKWWFMDGVPHPIYFGSHETWQWKVAAAVLGSTLGVTLLLLIVLSLPQSCFSACTSCLPLWTRQPKTVWQTHHRCTEPTMELAAPELKAEYYGTVQLSEADHS